MSEQNQFINTFRQEANELLDVIEDAILTLEKKPDDKESIHLLFRAFHTIKGSGAMFGFDDIAEFTHHVENLLDKVRDGVVPVTRNLTDLILTARDQIKTMLDATDSNSAYADTDFRNKIIEKLEHILSGKDEKKPLKIASEAENKDRSPSLPSHSNSPPIYENKKRVFRIRFYPHIDIFASGTDPASLLNELRVFGEYMIQTCTDHIPPLETLNPEYCYFSWNVILITTQDIDSIKDVFIFVEDQSQIAIEEIQDYISKDAPDTIFSLSNEIQIHNSEDIEKESFVPGEEADNKEKKSLSDTATVRVASEKLDLLINLVGEMVINQARLNRVTAGINKVGLCDIVKDSEYLIRKLRNCAMDMRMLPIGTVFGKFKRLVRDLSAELEKEVELITKGAETEMDKTVIERLNNPLVHLIRNAIDHDIEPPEEREKAGKPRCGTIRLNAAHKGTHVVITVKADGKGIDTEHIRKKAIEKGFLSPNAVLSEKEALYLIFAPGFSTKEKITSVSGRGVGMDVVKRDIESLGGTIQIFSTKGKGTTCELLLPLTLAIIDGLLVKVSKVRYILPISPVVKCMELSKLKEGTKDMIMMEEEVIPLIRLREIFSVPGNKPKIEQVIIVQSEDMKVGIVTDQILGTYQTLIKSLGRTYKDEKRISGATIMDDGTVILILDIHGIVRCAYKDENKIRLRKGG